MTLRTPLPSAALLLAVALAGCSDSTDSSREFVVTGTIQNNSQEPIPPDARVVVAWGVSSGSPDYSYVFGEGTLDPAAGTFRIQFDQPPPSQALNAGALGVGIILVTTNQSLQNGDDLTTVAATELIGAAGQFGVIFTTTPEQASQYRGWAADFEAGYGVGVGIQVPGDFDRFDPASPSSVVLIIDDLQNIEFVNWT
jgi:hypothetical protein